MESQTVSKTTVQSEASQELTKPVDTALYTTPTLTFGEVGLTGNQLTDGWESGAHGVGHFENTRLLERMVELGTFEWGVTDLGNDQLLKIDVDAMLRMHPRNADILAQFQYYRTDIEVTMRLNTNQFYFGALLAALYPTDQVYESIDARAVMDPTVISASSAESIIKEWHYSWPEAWRRIHDDEGTFPVFFVLHVLAPLLRAKVDMPDNISFVVWARFKNIQLSYPIDPVAPALRTRRVESQSAEGKIVVSKSAPRSVAHPAEDSRGGAGTMTRVSGIVNHVASDAEELVTSLPSLVTGALTDLLGTFDRPDKTDVQQPMVVEPSKDMYNCDLPDSNVSVGMYAARYVDPSKSRMPMTKNWSVSDYSRIPGLRKIGSFANLGEDVTTDLIIRHPEANTDFWTPLDFAFLNASLWRGSLKVCFQFFTSSFISARIGVQFRNNQDSPLFPADYTNGLSRVINVKGDTVNTMTLPWLHWHWWAAEPFPEIKLTCLTDVASTDASADSIIYVVIWVAGGDDIQFAWPRVPIPTEWTRPTPAFVESQASMGAIFQKTFPPIVENVTYDVDHGAAHAEELCSITDVCKRYSLLTPSPNTDNNFRFQVMDENNMTPDATALYSDWWAFRSTFFGSWRSAFLFRSGGVRFREFYPLEGTDRDVYSIRTQTGFPANLTNKYVAPYDKTGRITVPQFMSNPYGVLGQQQFLLRADKTAVTGVNRFIAARDDLQLGYPILPWPLPPTPEAPGVSQIRDSESRPLAKSSQRIRRVKEPV